MTVQTTIKKREALRNTLELMLRRCSGNDLQKFLGKVMSKVHKDNFVPIGTAYTQGDMKCDGMLLDPLTVFACYGPVNGGATTKNATMKNAAKKVRADFDGALKQWPDLKSWIFVTNYISDNPAPVVSEIAALKREHPGITIKLFGQEQFENTIFELDPIHIEDLLSSAATEEDFRRLHPPEVLSVVEAVMAQAHSMGLYDDEPTVIPEDKLGFNGLSKPYRDEIVQGLSNALRVSGIVSGHPNPMLAIQVAGVFKAKYLELKAQGFAPDDIMDLLHDFAAAGHKRTPSRDAAVVSVLAFLFEKCTIFEDRPVESAA